MYSWKRSASPANWAAGTAVDDDEPQPSLIWQSIRIPIQQTCQATWVRLTVEIAKTDLLALAFAAIVDETSQGRRHRIEMIEQPPGGRSTLRRFSLITYLSSSISDLNIEVVTSDELEKPPVLSIRPLRRWQAALRLLLDEPARVCAALSSLRGHAVASWPGVVRRALAAPAAPVRSSEDEYALWVKMFEPARPGDCNGLERPRIGVLVYAPLADDTLLAATLAALGAQFQPAEDIVIWQGGQRDRLPPGDYVAILQAGEIPSRAALAIARRELLVRGLPELALADEDSLSSIGRRCRPLFKPEPNHALMLSGTLAGGMWLMRRDVVDDLGLGSTSWAEVARLDFWFRLNEARGLVGVRLPYVLTHRRHDTLQPPREDLAGVVAAHLRRTDLPLTSAPNFPISLYLRRDRPLRSVDILVPSSLMKKQSVACIDSIIRGTDYPPLKVQVGIGQPGPLQGPQLLAEEALHARGVEVVQLPIPAFNFSTVVNRLAARGRSDLILLLNDDVSPLSRDWLRWMAAFLKDGRVGVVGARLLYPSGNVQHGGIIMGLGGLCEHANRGLPREADGYAARAVLAQELSAVTGACMLIRRQDFEAAGGFDEGYPSAYNDVDFCLRMREAGFGIVYAAQAELTHHELQTYGSHYAGERAAFQVEETGRMLRRWSAVMEADPFHNPNLRLEAGMEWRPVLSRAPIVGCTTDPLQKLH